jgi:uncharacterized membrane protein YkvA (DUF1232 family)
MPWMMAGLSSWARSIKRDTLALYLAARDPRTPWYAKALAAVVVAYALSPIDLIPDFIPVLGYVDDLLILPLGIWATVKLIPPRVMEEHRARAETLSERPVSRTAALVIIAIWIGVAIALGWFVYTALLRE